MLFTNILLSVWFVLWLAYAVFVKDVGKIIIAFFSDMCEDEEDDEYHETTCENCGHSWYSVGDKAKFCPKCGKEL